MSVLLVVLLALATLPALASTPVKFNQKDYVFQETNTENAGHRIEVLEECSPCWGGLVNYTPFYSPFFGEPVQTYEALRYDGVDVTLIIPVEHPNQKEVTTDRLRALVDRLDILYKSYVELLEWEPVKTADPLNKQVFAVLPDNPPWFYGVAISPGDSSEYANSVLLETALDDDILSNVWKHELLHNFDPVYIWDHGPDPGHDWTTALLMWFNLQQSKTHDAWRVSWKESAQRFRDQHWTPYLEDDELDWSLCASQVPRPEQCAERDALYLTGSLIGEAALYMESTQVRDWLRAGLAEQKEGISYASDLEKSDAMLSALARITQTDVRCLAEFAKWPIGPSLDAVSSEFKSLFPGCLDADQDQWIAFEECDDKNPQRFPGNVETEDEIDNDCNSLVDDVTLFEGDEDLPLFWEVGDIRKFARPVNVAGTLEERAPDDNPDADTVFFKEIPEKQIRFELCSDGPDLAANGINKNRIAFGWISRVPAGECRSGSLQTDQTWVGIEVFAQPEGSVKTGDWRLSIWDPVITWDQRDLPGITRQPFGNVRAQGFSAVNETMAPSTEIRWHLNGEGFVKSGPIADPGSWLAPEIPANRFDEDNRPVQLRAVLWDRDMQASEPSPPYLVPAAALLEPMTPAAEHSGSWFSPAHDGEGFILEMLSPDSAVAYWFTYDVRDWARPAGEARQFWYLANLKNEGGRLAGDLVKVSGGAFGNNLDPDQIRQTPVGWMQIEFGSEKTGVVHFNVEGRSGEYALQRLYGLHAKPNASGLSGSWYDPGFSGQGVIVQEFARNQLAITLFTHNQQSQPIWSTMLANVDEGGNIAISGAPRLTEGGLIGRGFRPESVTEITEGEASLQAGCSDGQFKIALPSIDAEQQTLSLTRLTTPMGVQCP